jgi:hypothetical protein
MMNQGLERRLAALEAAGGADVIGICYADTPDVVKVAGSGVTLTPSEFAYDHPRSLLIRVVYADGLHPMDERSA